MFITSLYWKQILQVSWQLEPGAGRQKVLADGTVHRYPVNSNLRGLMESFASQKEPAHT